MGFGYLEGKSWSEVTRDERFFCMQLYRKILERGVADFVRFVNERCGTSLSPDCEWEVGYEVCFYRDFYHLKEKKVPLLSPKRTFDLCLFSEDTIVIIEAKCFQEFALEQLDIFAEDRERLQSLPGLEKVNVLLLGLASGRYRPGESIAERFEEGTRFLTWEDLAAHYGNDPVLKRAGDIYDESARVFDCARNTGGYRSIDSLLASLREGDDFWVGRSGGLKAFHIDVQNKNFPSSGYQTNRSDSDNPPASRNWFRLSEVEKFLEENYCTGD